MNSGFAQAIVSGIVLVVLLVCLIVPRLLQKKANEKAKNSPPVKATVLKVETGSNVIFGLNTGERVTMFVPNNTYVEGDKGMLRYQQKRYLSPTGFVEIATFGSFDVIKS